MFWAISIGIGAALMQIDPAMALESADLKPEELTAIRDRVREVDEVVRKNPSDPINYNNRAILKQQLGDVAGALADYNRAIELAPNFASAYSNRAYMKFTKFLLTKDALADYDRAISIDPRHARAYANRAMLKYNSLKDSAGAIADIQQAAKFYQAEGNEELAKVALNYANIWEAASINTSKTTVTVATNTPNKEAVAAYQRGWEKNSKGNRKGAIVEYNTAIFLDANYADAYYNRGLIRKATGFKKAAIADLVTAANIYRQQQQQANFQEAMSIVRELKGEFTPRPKN